MSLSIGIVGLPNVGKSTLFKIITRNQVECANYPFCTVDPNIGVIATRDKRVDMLAKFSCSLKKIQAVVEFVDIAGLIKGASLGEGLGNKFLANIRETDAILYVLRSFENKKIINTQNEVSPFSDKEILDTELALKDIETIEKRISKIDKKSKFGDDKIKFELEILNKAKDCLKDGTILIDNRWEPREKRILDSYQLLTIKPRLYLLNGNHEKISSDILKKFKEKKMPFFIIDILSELESIDFTMQEKKELGLPLKSKVDELINMSYSLLNLITFFTTGEDETRAWMLKRGEKAPQAGGVIHSDFEKNFIKADVINWQKLIDSGSFSAAREKGLIRIEGKDYVVCDGDVVEIKSSA